MYKLYWYNAETDAFCESVVLTEEDMEQWGRKTARALGAEVVWFYK